MHIIRVKYLQDYITSRSNAIARKNKRLASSVLKTSPNNASSFVFSPAKKTAK